MQNYILRVEYLLLKKIPVLVYSGQNNMIVPVPSVMRWMDQVEFEQKQEFDTKSFSKWQVNNKTVGVMKMAGLLELRVIFDAGHYVPLDQPLVAKSMVTEFVGRVAR